MGMSHRAEPVANGNEEELGSLSPKFGLADTASFTRHFDHHHFGTCNPCLCALPNMTQGEEGRYK
ncbi:hypothetical protein E2C01_101757 [Portunus trituberculatus]|uniref:Uncharacterized protein n=1 Tax=Portunus trituberculatus TaxID=210409 RepID=A0A5B7K6G5_PORTR|nr:hypothetical protein [Portunus trituberculatus]